MSQTHNINYYTGLWDKYTQIKRDYTEKMQYEEYLYPDLLITRPLSNAVASKVLYPLVSHSYSLVGRLAVKVTALYSRSSADWLENSWHDPVETTTLSSLGKWIQRKTIVIAKQTPTEIPILVYFHRTGIVAARSVYILSKDLTTLLEVPQGLHNYVTGYIEKSVEPPASKEEGPKTLLGRVWTWIRHAIEWLRDGFNALICKVAKVTEKPLKKVPKVKSFFETLKEDVKRGSLSIQKFLVEKTHGYIADGETLLRKRVVAKISEVALKNVLRSGVHTGIKIGISVGVYELGKSAFVHYTQTHELAEQVEIVASRVLRVVGGYLFIRYMAPTVQALHDDYRPEFDEEASTLSELISQLSIKNIFKGANLLKSKFYY